MSLAIIDRSLYFGKQIKCYSDRCLLTAVFLHFISQKLSIISCPPQLSRLKVTKTDLGHYSSTKKELETSDQRKYSNSCIVFQSNQLPPAAAEDAAALPLQLMRGKELQANA